MLTPLPLNRTRTPATRRPLRRTVAVSRVLRRTGMVLRLSVTRRQPWGSLLVPPGTALPLVVLLPPPAMAMWVGVSGTGAMTGPLAVGGRSSHTRTSSMVPLKPRSQEPR